MWQQSSQSQSSLTHQIKNSNEIKILGVSSWCPAFTMSISVWFWKRGGRVFWFWKDSRRIYKQSIKLLFFNNINSSSSSFCHANCFHIIFNFIFIIISFWRTKWRQVGWNNWLYIRDGSIVFLDTFHKFSFFNEHLSPFVVGWVWKNVDFVFLLNPVILNHPLRILRWNRN